MATVRDLEQRVQRIEEDLAVLKQRVDTRVDAGEWVDHVSGSMEDIAEFEQVVELGAEFRRSQLDSYTPPATDQP